MFKTIFFTDFYTCTECNETDSWFLKCNRYFFDKVCLSGHTACQLSIVQELSAKNATVLHFILGLEHGTDNSDALVIYVLPTYILWKWFILMVYSFIFSWQIDNNWINKWWKNQLW